MRERYPGVPVVTYVNTSAAVKAESDICCTSGNALKIVESLGADTVIMLPDEYLAQNVAAQTGVQDHRLGRPLRGARTLHRRRGPRAARRSSRRDDPGASGMPARGGRRGRLRRLDRGHGRLCRPRTSRAGRAADRMLDERQRRGAVIRRSSSCAPAISART